MHRGQTGAPLNDSPEPWSAGPAARHARSCRVFRSVKHEASPATSRFTARTVEDRSTGRAGMDGVLAPGPSYNRDRGRSPGARDVTTNYQSRRRLTRGLSHCIIQIVSKNQYVKNTFHDAESVPLVLSHKLLRCRTLEDCAVPHTDGFRRQPIEFDN